MRVASCELKGGVKVAVLVYVAMRKALGSRAVYSTQGMNGLDGGGWRRTASREAPISQNQRNSKVPTALATRLFRSQRKLSAVS